jgi:hypothetical protein
VVVVPAAAPELPAMNWSCVCRRNVCGVSDCVDEMPLAAQLELLPIK